MTIPSEFDLILIERRADLLAEIALRLIAIADEEWERGDDESDEAIALRMYSRSTESRYQADAVHKLASDVPMLLALVHELKGKGGRESSALAAQHDSSLPTQ